MKHCPNGTDRLHNITLHNIGYIYVNAQKDNAVTMVLLEHKTIF